MKWNAFSVVEEAIARTKKLLFPFNLKYWMKLGFVSLLSMGGFSGWPSPANLGNWSVPLTNEKSSGVTGKAIANLIDKTNGSLIGVLIGIFLILALIFSYVCSVFTFIFLEALIKKDYSIKNSWKNNRARGGSLFGFLILAGLIFLIVSLIIFFPIVLKISKLGFVEYIMSFSLSDFFILLLLFLIFLIWWLIYGIFMTFVIDFSLWEMYFSNVNITEAIKRTFKNIQKQKLESFVYYLARVVFGICIGLIGAFVLIVVLVVALIPALIIFLPLYFLSKISILILLVPFLLFLLYVYAVACLPLTSFMRYFSLICYEKLFNKKVLVS